MVATHNTASATTSSPQIRDAYLTDPESFKELALASFPNNGGFMGIFGGDLELRNHGNKTMWLDDQSMQEILKTMTHLRETIRGAKVVKAKPHLLVVK